MHERQSSIKHKAILYLEDDSDSLLYNYKSIIYLFMQVT